MPDTNSPGPNSSSPGSPGSGDAPAGGGRNLPVPVAPARGAGSNGEGWIAWALRTLFGRRPESFRSDLRSVLESRTSDIGLSLRESAMLSNILSLRERRAADVMVPRADIIA